MFNNIRILSWYHMSKKDNGILWNVRLAAEPGLRLKTIKISHHYIKILNMVNQAVDLVDTERIIDYNENACWVDNYE